MKRIRKYLGILGLYFLSLGLLFFTNPQHLRPVFLVVPLFVFFLAVFLSLVVLLGAVMSRRDRPLTRNNVIALAVITAFPVLLILLQSIGQLSVRDIITLVLIILILGFYVSKSAFGKWPAKH